MKKNPHEKIQWSINRHYIIITFSGSPISTKTLHLPRKNRIYKGATRIPRCLISPSCCILSGHWDLSGVHGLCRSTTFGALFQPRFFTRGSRGVYNGAVDNPLGCFVLWSFRHMWNNPSKIIKTIVKRSSKVLGVTPWKFARVASKMFGPWKRSLHWTNRCLSWDLCEISLVIQWYTTCFHGTWTWWFGMPEPP